MRVNKKGTPVNGMSLIYTEKVSAYMVRPARFERATAWFVARYSIQLSYGR